MEELRQEDVLKGTRQERKWYRNRARTAASGPPLLRRDSGKSGGWLGAKEAVGEVEGIVGGIQSMLFGHRRQDGCPGKAAKI
jgi:hypothetical protein